jgi:hypothetical protein
MSSLVGPNGKVGNKIPEGHGLAQYNQYTPQQQKIFKQSGDKLGPDSYLSRLSQGEEGIFDQLEEPALRQFNELQGGIASRFSQGAGGRGAMSSRRSSGFQNASSASASNFAQQLQSQRMQLMRQAQQDLHGMSQDFLGNRPYETQLYEKQKEQSSFGKWAPLIGGAVGGIVGLAGGPFGAAAGFSAGQAVGNAFG